MFAFIKGIVFDVELNEKIVIIDTGSIGYKIFTPNIKEFTTDELEILHTHVIYSENDQRVFGFKHKIELNIFKHLIQVNGIGPKTALEIISTYQKQTFIDLMLENDDVAIKNILKVKGVGKKSAQTLLISVREKLILLNNGKETKNKKIDDEMDDLPNLIAQALGNLGFMKKDLIKTKSDWFDKAASHEVNIKNFLQWRAKNN
jgi:Holliday junction DNA helicase RuvA